MESFQYNYFVVEKQGGWLLIQLGGGHEGDFYLLCSSYSEQVILVKSKDIIKYITKYWCEFGSDELDDPELEYEFFYVLLDNKLRLHAIYMWDDELGCSKSYHVKYDIEQAFQVAMKKDFDFFSFHTYLFYELPEDISKLCYLWHNCRKQYFNDVSKVSIE